MERAGRVATSPPSCTSFVTFSVPARAGEVPLRPPAPRPHQHACRPHLLLPVAVSVQQVSMKPLTSEPLHHPHLLLPAPAAEAPQWELMQRRRLRPFQKTLHASIRKNTGFSGENWTKFERHCARGGGPDGGLRRTRRPQAHRQQRRQTSRSWCERSPAVAGKKRRTAFPHEPSTNDDNPPFMSIPPWGM